MSKIVITMPAYHAEGTLAKTVADIPAGTADELILVDDASADNTVDVARELGGIVVYVHPENRGYGGNQKTCYTKALEHDADIIVLLHPDYQYDPKAVPLLIAPILAGYADFTFGSRFAGMGDPRGGGMPRYRYVGNRLTTTLENLMLGSRFSEMHSGLRAYTRACLLSLPFLSYTDDFAFDSQMMVDALTSGLRVVEVPIVTRYTKESSSISVARSMRYVGHSLTYAAKKSLARGRRGRRFPVAGRGSRMTRPDPDRSELVRQRCVVCSGTSMVLLYPATADAAPSVAEFACTSDALGQHDDILQCLDCGMVSSRPSVQSGEILKNYEDMVDDDYLAEQDARTELFNWVLDAVDSYLVPGRRLVEVGSNIGLFLKIAELRGWDAKGIEPSRWAVERGRSLFSVDLEQGTLDDLGDEPSSADVVVSLDVLEHLTDPVEELTKMRRLLNRDGLLALSTINLASVHARVRDGSWPWFIRPHLHYFTPETLDATLARAGFKMVQWSVVPRSFHLSYVARRAAESMGRLGRAAERLSRIVDPKLPVGWLGDVIFVIARPVEDLRSDDATVVRDRYEELELSSMHSSS